MLHFTKKLKNEKDLFRLLANWLDTVQLTKNGPTSKVFESLTFVTPQI